MAIPILHNWKIYFSNNDEGLGSSYERVVINQKLLQLCQKFNVSNLLESPSFGFTGISGINSFAAAQSGISVTLTDHDQTRINLVENIWDNLDTKINANLVSDYANLPFEDNQFDLSWNFSAMWFTKDLSAALSELCRVSRKAVLICVPNRSGLGYLSQKFLEKEDLNKYLKEANIIPQNIITEMDKLGWKLVEHNFMDCPWWPDIGMPKAKFLSNFGLRWLLKEKKHQPISIVDYYKGNDPEFSQKMLKHYWFEKYVPNFFKTIWSHHKYYLFEKK
ncbi:MAG: methyltransferase domain-containing protein [Candidatus Cloacimonetes bacterium]|nr:methyltransferase domain-containing protein [Candidatus Cloacimonadota bacterium]